MSKVTPKDSFKDILPYYYANIIFYIINGKSGYANSTQKSSKGCREEGSMSVKVRLILYQSVRIHELYVQYTYTCESS